MWIARGAGLPEVGIGSDGTDAARAAIWWDLLRPTDDEIALAERCGGRHVPRRDEVEEIETSSRQYERDGAIYLSMPLLRRTPEGDVAEVNPVGIVVAPDRFVTVRYSDYETFDALGAELAGEDAGERASKSPDRSAAGLALSLFEGIVNRMADILERVDGALNARSRTIFRDQDRSRNGGQRSGRAATARMRASLRALGTAGDLASAVRETLLGVDRGVRFLSEHAMFRAQGLQGRIGLLGRDAASLADFVGHVNAKIQFLLDATLGFISIDQNDNMKVLTVISAIGIPPTLVASIYGMNFKVMPELEWQYGYWYGLSVIALSAIGPLFVFWRLGWIGRR